MDVSGLAPNPAHMALAATRPVQTPPTQTRVTARDELNKTGTEPRGGEQTPSRQDVNAAEMRAQRVRFDEKPAGPPPSFDVSLLEVESDLKQIIARIDAERTQERDHGAIQPSAADDAQQAHEAEARPEAAPAMEAQPETAEARGVSQEDVARGRAPENPLDS